MNGSRSLSAWCVDHPVATLLLTFALVLLGMIAFPRLAIAPLPEAEFPTIQVTAQLPGASPDTMASSVATPLEVQFSAIPGMTQMTSSSALGSSLPDPAIHPRQEHRHRRPGSAGGDQHRVRQAAQRHAEPADLEEGQPGGQPGADPQRQLRPACPAPS